MCIEVVFDMENEKVNLYLNPIGTHSSDYSGSADLYMHTISCKRKKPLRCLHQ